MKTISIHQYLTDISHVPLIDVRSPIEYEKGHIPGALNLPLFTNEERALIGTVYKREGQDIAIKKGLEVAGAKMSGYVEQLKDLVTSKEIAIYCWRGGRRSNSLAWLFHFVGYEVSIIEKGYKAYRRYNRDLLNVANLKFIVLGGCTGSGKTKILHELHRLGEQVIDLEGLANHKGSAFGGINESAQPSTEQFENLLCTQINALDHSRRIWIENESKGIGKVYLPEALWDKMKNCPLINIKIPQDQRAEFLASTYGKYDSVALRQGFESITKRIGGQNLQIALDALDQKDYNSAATIALKYYDKTYLYNLKNNPSPKIINLECATVDARLNAQKILDHIGRETNV